MTSIQENSTENTDVKAYIDKMFDKVSDTYLTVFNGTDDINIITARYNVISKFIPIIIKNINLYSQYLSDFYQTSLKQDLENMQEILRNEFNLLKDRLDNGNRDKISLKSLLRDLDKGVKVVINYHDGCIKFDSFLKGNHSQLTMGNQSPASATVGDQSPASVNFQDVMNAGRDAFKSLNLDEDKLKELIIKLLDDKFREKEIKDTEELNDEYDETIAETTTVESNVRHNARNGQSGKCIIQPVKNTTNIEDKHIKERVENELTADELSACQSLGILTPANTLPKAMSNSSAIKAIIIRLNSIIATPYESNNDMDDIRMIADNLRKANVNADMLLAVYNKLDKLEEGAIMDYFTSNFNKASSLHKQYLALCNIHERLKDMTEITSNCLYMYGMRNYNKFYSLDKATGKKLPILHTACIGKTEVGAYNRNCESKEFGVVGTDDMNLSAKPKASRNKAKVIAYDAIGENTFIGLLFRMPYSSKTLESVETTIKNCIGINDTTLKRFYANMFKLSYQNSMFVQRFDNLSQYDDYKLLNAACNSDESFILSHPWYLIAMLGATILTLNSAIVGNDNNAILNVSNNVLNDLVKLYNNADFINCSRNLIIDYIDNIRGGLYGRDILTYLVLWHDAIPDDEGNMIDTYDMKALNITYDKNATKLMYDVPEGQHCVNVRSNDKVITNVVAKLFDLKKFDIAIPFNIVDDESNYVLEGFIPVVEVATNISTNRDFMRLAILQCLCTIFGNFNLLPSADVDEEYIKTINYNAPPKFIDIN